MQIGMGTWCHLAGNTSARYTVERRASTDPCMAWLRFAACQPRGRKEPQMEMKIMDLVARSQGFDPLRRSCCKMGCGHNQDVALSALMHSKAIAGTVVNVVVSVSANDYSANAASKKHAVSDFSWTFSTSCADSIQPSAHGPTRRN